MPEPTLRFFLDHCVAKSVGDFLNDSGHNASFLKDELSPDSIDHVVAAQALHDERILVSVDSDFKKMRNRLSITAQRFQSLHTVLFTCGHGPVRSRIEFALPYVEFAWERRSTRVTKPLRVEIQGAAIRIID